MQITQDIRYIGVNDRKIDLFEGQYPVPSGMAYNSYAIIDEKIAILDTVDATFGDEWMGNIRALIGERAPDYLVVHHMEPDHSSNIARFASEYPNAIIVSSAKSFSIMQNFFGTDFAEKRIVVSDGSSLSLGKHTLTFITAPMVHWPEVVMSYDSTDKILFSADAFGKFGALDADEEWTDEARRYYIGIVGKYGAQVQSVLKKAAGLDIQKICSLHGPALDGDISRYIKLYDTWSSYTPEDDGVLIAYASIYGNTKKAALSLCELLRQKGVFAEAVDLARTDISEATAKAFQHRKLVLASSTYNLGVFPPMREFLSHLTERNFQSRTVAIIENGSWAPMAAKVIKTTLESCKNLEFTETTVTIRSAVNDETIKSLQKLADELL